MTISHLFGGRNRFFLLGRCGGKGLRLRQGDGDQENACLDDCGCVRDLGRKSGVKPHSKIRSAPESSSGALANPTEEWVDDPGQDRQDLVAERR